MHALIQISIARNISITIPKACTILINDILYIVQWTLTHKSIKTTKQTIGESQRVRKHPRKKMYRSVCQDSSLVWRKTRYSTSSIHFLPCLTYWVPGISSLLFPPCSNICMSPIKQDQFCLYIFSQNLLSWFPTIQEKFKVVLNYLISAEVMSNILLFGHWNIGLKLGKTSAILAANRLNSEAHIYSLQACPEWWHAIIGMRVEGSESQRLLHHSLPSPMGNHLISSLGNWCSASWGH